ncbi:MAG: SUMF1/EgtB/PvdO family nonheme iron enzyme [Planctomycetota bacterium]
MPASQTEVPAALLVRLRAQYIPEETKTPNVSENDKVHRYEAILREGRWAERQYAQAANLYEVRELMMAAAKGLATLEGSAEARQLVSEIASRIANSSAPPESRVMAEMLFVRGRINELADYPAEAADELAAFVARYRGTSGEPKAMVGAAEFCRMAGTPTRSDYLQQLSEKHVSAPGVIEFLEAEHINPFPGRLMNARLVCLDGSVLTLPRDTLGKFTVVHFWSMAKSGLVERAAKGVVSLWPQYKPFRAAGVEFVGVNLDSDRTRVARFIRDECVGVDWPQTCSGLGLNDPTFRKYRVQTLPAYWLIGPDGRVISDNYHGGVQPWSQFCNTVRDIMGQIRETAIRMPYYRSGEFLLPSPSVRGVVGEGAAEVPAEQLNELRRKVLLPPALGLSKDRKAAALREALELGRTIEKNHPRAANLPVVWNAMLVAARWLATETPDKTPDKALAKQAQAIAARILQSKAEGPSRLLADYVRASGELAAGEFSRQESAQRIDAFVENYAHGKLNWAAGVLGVVLAMECGDEDTRVALVAELGGYVDQCPKVRGFLRDFCDVNVDAQTTQVEPSLPFGGAVPREVRGELPKLDGGTLRLVDLKGKLVMIHFWSIACPAFATPEMRSGQGMAPDPNQDMIVIGVNLDRSREKVEKYLKQHDEYKGWIHVFSGLGQDDSLARELDIYDMPRSVFLGRNGTIYRWGRPARMGSMDYRNMSSLSKPRPASGGTTEISLDLGGKVAMKFALIPAGSVWMGSPPNGKGCFDDEVPQRHRYFAKPFYMGVHHVTRSQFAAFVQQTNYKTEAEQEGWALVWNGGWQKVEGASWRKCGFDQNDDHPVVCVSWNDAVEFCNWLGRTSGKTVRLPTEARWEYACRAGTETIYPWGCRPEQGIGWCNAADRTAAKKFPGWLAFDWDDGHVFTSPVGKFKANAFGLYDMTGNAWQWSADWYDPELLKPKGPLTDTTGPGGGTYHVARGGSWQSGPNYCRSAVRRMEASATRTNMLGFRVVVETP